MMALLEQGEQPTPKTPLRESSCQRAVGFHQHGPGRNGCPDSHHPKACGRPPATREPRDKREANKREGNHEEIPEHKQAQQSLAASLIAVELVPFNEGYAHLRDYPHLALGIGREIPRLSNGVVSRYVGGPIKWDSVPSEKTPNLPFHSRMTILQYLDCIYSKRTNQGSQGSTGLCQGAEGIQDGLLVHLRRLTSPSAHAGPRAE
jgi:hypothetical protein